MEMDWREMDLSKNGFTLIEIVIALTVFSIGVLSIIGMLVIGENGIKGGNKSFTAVQAAKAQMELLRASLIPDAISDTCSTLSESNIQCEWSVQKDDPAEGLSTIEVVATWQEGEKKRELVLTYLRFDND